MTTGSRMYSRRRLAHWLLGSSALSVFAAETSATFVIRSLEWDSGPPGGGYQTAIGRITVAQSGGRLLTLDCSIFRDAKGGSLSFNLNSGYVIRAGRWRLLRPGSIEVRLRVVAREKVAYANRTEPAASESREVWGFSGLSLMKASALKTDSGEQIPVRFRNAQELDALVKRYVG